MSGGSCKLEIGVEGAVVVIVIVVAIVVHVA